MLKMRKRFSLKHDFLSMYFNVPVSLQHSLFYIFMSPSWHFFKSAAVLLLPKDLLDFPSNNPHASSVLPTVSMHPWPLDLAVFDPMTSVLVCVWQVSEGDAERVREPWLGDPTQALVTGVMGLLLPPVRLSVRPAASGGPWVLHSLRFLPSPENSTAGKPTFVLMMFMRISLLLNEIPKCF